MRRLHPLTLVLQAFGHAVQGLGIPIFGFAVLSFLFEDLPPGTVVVLGAVGLALGAGYGAASYLRFEYELAEDALVVHSGVFARREREIPYGRIQNVDTERDLLKRLLGAAVVRVETAGGGSTEAVFDFVSGEEAERIQRVVRERRRAEGEREARPTESAPESEGETEPSRTGEPRTEALFELRLGELAVYALSTFRPGAVAFVVFLVPFVQGSLGDAFTSYLGAFGIPTSLAELTFERALVSLLIAGPTTAFGAYLFSAAYGAVAYYGFRLTREGDDLRYERGLLQRYTGSIPLSKVQTLSVGEPLPMRLLGYAGLAIETAGYSPGGNDERRVASGPPSAVPAAAVEETLALARRIEPFGGMELEVQRPPTVARRRYAVRYALLAAGIVALSYAAARALGGGPWYVAFLAFLPVLPAAHLKWKHMGYRAGEDHLVLRRGFWNRTTHVVPYERLQTVIRERSLFQRRLGLATLVAGTASSATLGGDVPAAVDIDEGEAERLHRRCRERLQERLGAGR